MYTFGLPQSAKAATGSSASGDKKTGGGDRALMTAQMGAHPVRDQLRMLQPKLSAIHTTPAPMVQRKPDEKSGSDSQKNDSKLDPKSNPSTPPAVFKDASFSFSLPGDATLSSAFRYNVYTQPEGRTWVSLTVSRNDLLLEFKKPLRLDLQWPFADVLFAGIRWNFKGGHLNWVGLEHVPWNGPIEGVGHVRGAIIGLVDDLFAGTGLRKGKFDPLRDAGKLGAMLKKIQSNTKTMFSSKKGGKSPINEDHDKVVTRLVLPKGVNQQAGKHAIEIAPGSVLTLSTPLSTLTSVAKGNPSISHVDIGCSVNIKENGKPLVWIGGIRVSHGGHVTATHYEFAKSVKKTKKTGKKWVTGFQLFAHLFTREGMLRLHVGRPKVNTKGVDRVAQAMLDEALTKALKKLLVQARGKVAKVDLEKALGMK